jgi:hypothetical protein
VDDTAFDPTKSDIMDSFIRRLNYNPHYSRMGGIGSVVKAERPDLKTLKIWYALLFTESDEVKRAVSFNLDNIKRTYDKLTVAQKQRLLDDFNRRLKRHIRSGPIFSDQPPPQPPGAGASAAAASSAYRVPEAPERVEPQMPAGPPTPSLKTLMTLWVLTCSDYLHHISHYRPDQISFCHPRLPLRRCP